MSQSEIKFSIFADLHDYPGVFYTDAAERLRKIQKRAEEEKCDAVFSLGDFCHRPEQSLELLRSFHDFSIPSYHVIGNHDCDAISLAELLKHFHLERNYYFKDIKGYRFVILDNNYYVDETGACRHFCSGPYMQYPDTRETLAEEQLEWLPRVLEDAPGPCIVLSHSSIEREDAIKNGEKIRAVLREANQKHPHRVLLAVNGHYHRNFLRIMDGIAYFELNSASYDWIDVPHHLYGPDIEKQYSRAANTIVYNDPVHAVITITGEDTVEIKGMKSSFFRNVSREMTDNPVLDTSGRPCVAEVLSEKFRLL